ncbi:hypothetical protein Tco_0645974 [Tanacetum coccineum]
MFSRLGVLIVFLCLKVEFRIDLVPEATSVAKSRYRLAPLEMQELFEQLPELQDKSFIRPGHFPSHVLWVEIGESSLPRLELVQETIDNVVLIKQKLKAARDRPKELCCLHVPLDEIKVDKTLCFVEEPVENSDREVKSGYAAMRTLLWAGKVASSKISCES